MEKYATGCPLYYNTAPTAKSEASATMEYAKSGLGSYNVGVVVKATLRASNASCYGGPQCHAMPFFNRADKGAAIVAKWGTNRE